jgi:ribonucleotide reductase beta subunit family protein with ferritin-like domain
MDEYKQGGSKLPKKVKDYLDGLYNDKLGQMQTKSLRKEESSSISKKEILQALIPVALNKEEIKQYMQSLSKSGDIFDNVDDYIEDFKNYIADKSIQEHFGRFLKDYQ